LTYLTQCAKIALDMAVKVRLIKVSNTETEKTLKLVLEYQEGDVSGGLTTTTRFVIIYNRSTPYVG
jgi:hypothetical protein